MGLAAFNAQRRIAAEKAAETGSPPIEGVAPEAKKKGKQKPDKPATEKEAGPEGTE